MISPKTLAASALSAAAFLFVCSCGVDNDQALEALGAAEIIDGDLNAARTPNTFLVNFKLKPRPSLLKNFRSFGKEYHSLMRTFWDEIGDHQALSIDYMTSLDMSGEFASSQQSSQPSIRAMDHIWKSLLPANKEGSVALVRFATEEIALRQIREWKQKDKIWYAEPDYISKLDNAFTIYDDQYQPFLQNNARAYWHNMIRLSQAFQHLAQEGLSPVSPIVAVLDSGVDLEHPYIKERIWNNPAVGAAGCANDLHGCNTTVGFQDVLGDGDVSPFNLQSDGTCLSENPQQSDGDCSHGTHVAGIVAAHRNGQELDVAGVCPMCQIMAVRLVAATSNPTDAGGDTPNQGETKVRAGIADSAIVRAFKYLSLFVSQTSGGAAVRVITASFGKFQRSRTVSLMIRQLRATGRGVMVIAAAGNEDSMRPNYPAGFADAIAVSNVNKERIKHPSSNFGRWVNIAAPGAEIWSTVPGKGPEFKDGTSMAAPVVAGVAGLLLSVYPELSFEELRDRLMLTADPTLYTEQVSNRAYIPTLEGEIAPIPLLGTGIVDALAAVRNERSNDIPLVDSLNRVTVACGSLRADRANSMNCRALVLLLMPLMLLFAQALFKRMT